MKRDHHASLMADEIITTKSTIALSWRRVLTAETSKMPKPVAAKLTPTINAMTADIEYMKSLIILD